MPQLNPRAPADHPTLNAGPLEQLSRDPLANGNAKCIVVAR